MKEMFRSLGSLAAWVVVGYGIQAAAWVEEKVTGEPAHAEEDEAAPRLARVA